MSTIDRTAESDDVFEARIARFEPERRNPNIEVDEPCTASSYSADGPCVLPDGHFRECLR